MGEATIVFLLIGGLGVVLLVIGLLGFDLFDFDGPVSVASIAAMLGAFGFTAAIIDAALSSRGGVIALPLAAAAGVAAALPAGWLAFRLGNAARKMHTDATPVRDDLLGLIGLVVSPIPADGLGQVRVTLSGQPVNLNARANEPLPVGTDVFVITTISETSVIVEELPTPASGTMSADT